MAVLAALDDSSGVPSVGQGPSPIKMTPIKRAMQTGEELLKDGSRDTVKHRLLLHLCLLSTSIRPPSVQMEFMATKTTTRGLALQKLAVDKENVQNRSSSSQNADSAELRRLKADLLAKEIELKKINEIVPVIRNQLVGGIQQPYVQLNKSETSNIVKQLVDVLHQLPESRDDSMEQTLCRVSHLEETISSFKSLQKDTMSCMGDMTVLLYEKDAAIANLLSEIEDNEERLQLYQRLISSFLRDKAVIKGQLQQLSDCRGEDDRQLLLHEIKYCFLLLSFVSLLTTIAYKREWFLLVAPLYFLFVFSDVDD